MGGGGNESEKRDLPWSAPPQPPSQPLAIAAEGQGWGGVGERQRVPLPIVSNSPGAPWGQSTGADLALGRTAAARSRGRGQLLSCPSWVTPPWKAEVGITHRLPLTVKMRINLISIGDGLGTCLVSEVESRWGNRQ